MTVHEYWDTICKNLEFFSDPWVYVGATTEEEYSSNILAS